MNQPRFIVAEVSVSWVGGGQVGKAPLSVQFEEAIEVNLKRGYQLHSWRMSQVVISATELVETIIAVFKWDAVTDATYRQEQG